MNTKHTFSALIIKLALLAVLLVPGSLARAQETEPITLATLTIRVWPEYDQPAALVFYIGQAAEGTTFPVDLRFQIPPGAVLNATAYTADQTGNLLTAVSRVEGNTVIVTSPNGSFHVEFYDPGLKIEGEQRTYLLVWPGDYPVGQLTWEVEQPAGSRDIAVEPAGGSWAIDSNNLQTYTVDQGGLEAGQQMTLSVSYAKSDSALSVDALAPGASGSTPQTTTTPSGDTWQIVALSVLITALMLVIIGLVIYGVRHRRAGVQAGAAGGSFCPNCGQAAGVEDRFCRQCGSSLD